MKLKDLIETSGLKLGYVAKEMGLSYGSLDKKLSGKIEFKTTEIAILKSLLNLSDKDVIIIFFNPESEYNSLKNKGVRGWKKKQKVSGEDSNL